MEQVSIGCSVHNKIWLVASIGGYVLNYNFLGRGGGGGGGGVSPAHTLLDETMAVYCHMSSCLFVILVPDLTVKLVLRPKDDPPLLGRNYKLECKHTLGPYVDSSKFKFTYEWFEVLSNDDKQIAKEKESSISFQPFKLPHVGIYYCKVTLSCEGKIVDEKETDELDMASLGMITHVSYLVISFLIHKYTLLVNV